jgi:cell wall-associated NlpC family hydrolase
MSYHWAFEYIGKPWRSGATGPDAYNCWGLVREVFLRRHGLPLPMVDVGTEANFQRLRGAVTAGGWARTEAAPAVDDVIVMRSAAGRHVGVLVEADSLLRVLHANGHQTLKGPTGTVMAQSLPELASGGYSEFEFWRRA